MDKLFVVAEPEISEVTAKRPALKCSKLPPSPHRSLHKALLHQVKSTEVKQRQAGGGAHRQTRLSDTAPGHTCP